MDIVIDHRIRDWVFIPIVLVMFMIGIFRYYLSQYMGNKKPRDIVTSKQEYGDVKDKNMLAYCQNIVKHNSFLTENSFKMRKYHLCKDNNGGFLTKKSQRPPKDALSTMMNSNFMVDMLKNNLSMAVSTMLQFAWVNYFFSGFILAKVPFPLTQKFRGMLQKGVDIQNLNVGYVSSLSLYFLILFGLSGLQRLILGGDEEDLQQLDDLAKMQTGMMMPGGGGGGMPGMPGQQPDFGKLYTSEKESIELVKHRFHMENSEDILKAKLRKIINNNKK